jgi:hypothetical protein
VLNIPVTEICLQGAGIVAMVGQREAAGVTQHMRVRLKLEASGLAGTVYHAGKRAVEQHAQSINRRRLK